jgi:outer membrane protein OmpA-like peptidoglycan-associated protein
MEWRGMKTAFAAVVSTMLCTPLFSQSYYVVVGAIPTEKKEIKEFTSYLPGQSSDTAYALTSGGSVMHFYVWKTNDLDLAVANAKKLREELDGPSAQTLETAPENNLSGNMLTSANGNKAAVTNASGGSTPAKPKGKIFKFTISTKEGINLPAQIHEVDLLEGRELATYSSDENVSVLRPGGEESAMVCGIFGYKESEKHVNYANPAQTEGAYLDGEGVWVIPYTLERLSKGDVSVMYNVSFYKDAVLMLPGSKNDLDELVRMMESNPNYVIKVHAHCNGKNSRKIITPGAENNNYFDVNGALEIQGSAKVLTNLRAEAVRAYLAEHGIDKERVKLYGWGGSEMLVEKTSPHAKINDRIEIEILKD